MGPLTPLRPHPGAVPRRRTALASSPRSFSAPSPHRAGLPDARTSPRSWGTPLTSPLPRGPSWPSGPTGVPGGTSFPRGGNPGLVMQIRPGSPQGALPPQAAQLVGERTRWCDTAPPHCGPVCSLGALTLPGRCCCQGFDEREGTSTVLLRGSGRKQ